MDAIGSSTKLTLLFVFIACLPIILLIFSTIIWTYNHYKRLSSAVYIIDIVLTLFILLIDIANLVSNFPWRNTIYHLCIWNFISFIIGMGCLIISVVFYYKNKAVSNAFINISTILSLIVGCIILKMTNM